MIEQDKPAVFMDAQCPRCGEICGNSGYGDTFRCYNCGWIGVIAIHPDDTKAIEGFIQRHQERNKEDTSEPALIRTVPGHGELTRKQQEQIAKAMELAFKEGGESCEISQPQDGGSV